MDHSSFQKKKKTHEQNFPHQIIGEQECTKSFFLVQVLVVFFANKLSRKEKEVNVWTHVSMT